MNASHRQKTAMLKNQKGIIHQLWMICLLINVNCIMTSGTIMKPLLMPMKHDILSNMPLLNKQTAFILFWSLSVSHTSLWLVFPRIVLMDSVRKIDSLAVLVTACQYLPSHYKWMSSSWSILLTQLNLITWQCLYNKYQPQSPTKY